MDENPVNFKNVSNEGKTYFHHGEIQGKKEVKVIISFLMIHCLYKSTQIDNTLISCLFNVHVLNVSYTNVKIHIKIVLCVIDRARSRGREAFRKP